MKHLKTFEDHVNEGWKENILVGLLSLFGVATMGQNKDKIEQYKTVHTDREKNRLVKAGWTLTSTERDTVWSEIEKNVPNTEVEALTLHFDKGEFFASGSFDITDNMKKSIDSILDIVKQEGYLLVKINIESSTDKNRVKESLQDLLKSKGFSADITDSDNANEVKRKWNLALSEARSSSIEAYLIGKEIDISLIGMNLLVEQGTKEFEQSARYVNVDFFCIKHTKDTIYIDSIPTINVEHELERSVDQPKNPPYKFRGGNIRVTKLGPISNNKKIQNLKCPRFNSKNGPRDIMTVPIIRGTNSNAGYRWNHEIDNHKKLDGLIFN